MSIFINKTCFTWPISNDCKFYHDTIIHLGDCDHDPQYWQPRLLCCIHLSPGSHLNIKTPSYQYRNSRYKDKTVRWPSDLYNGNSHTWKGVFYIETGPWFSAFTGCNMVFLTVESLKESWWGSDHVSKIFRCKLIHAWAPTPIRCLNSVSRRKK